MAIVGFEFNKINVVKSEKTRPSKLQIGNNVEIKKIERMDLNIGQNKQAGLRFNFIYTSMYAPDYATIELAGHVLFLGDEQKVTELLNKWNKEKKMEKEIMEPVMNTILQKSNIESIILCNSVNLPPPVPMPKVKAK